jgi:hypothetical protein
MSTCGMENVIFFVRAPVCMCSDVGGCCASAGGRAGGKHNFAAAAKRRRSRKKYGGCMRVCMDCRCLRDVIISLSLSVLFVYSLLPQPYRSVCTFGCRRSSRRRRRRRRLFLCYFIFFPSENKHSSAYLEE